MRRQRLSQNAEAENHAPDVANAPAGAVDACFQEVSVDVRAGRPSLPMTASRMGDG
jgi:hypothetical protein